MNSGNASQAVFAFERVQATDPEYRDVGLWLAIAYYDSGDRQRAKAGFEAVLAQSGDAKSRAKAERYLAVIREGPAQQRPSLLGKVEIGAGYDTNITNTSPAYAGAAALAAGMPAPASNRGGIESILNAGVEGRFPVSAHYAFVSADEERRVYSGHSVMNSRTLITKGGMNFEHDGDVYRIGVAQRQFRQQGTFFAASGMANDYDIAGVDTSAKLKLTTQDHLGFVAQYNQFRLLANSAENTNQVVLGANFTHSFRLRGSPMLYVAYAHLNDQALQTKTSPNPDQGVTVASRGTDIVTLYLQYSLSADVDIVSTDYAFFRKDTGAFARDPVVDFGKDRTGFASLGVNWRVRPEWTLRSQLARMVNGSNIALYSYSKTEGTVVLRRDFN